VSNKRSGPEQLPFFQDYVSKILRPKIEEALEHVKHDMHGAIWSALVEELSESGEDVGMDSVQLHEFLEQQLGLWIKISIRAGFSTESGESQSQDNATGIDNMIRNDVVEGEVVKSEDGSADPVEVRRSGSGSGRPLVSAVTRHGNRD